LDEGWAFSGETITLSGFGGSPYKARETGEAFRMLEKAMLLELSYPLTSVIMPMISDQKKAAEQIAAQELKSLSFDVETKRHFWIRAKRGSAGEVDLVYPFDGQLISIEVKSGHNARLKSLHQFMGETPHDIAVRIWTGKYSIDEVKTQSHKTFRLINLPFYLISALPDILGNGTLM
jgi:IS30 family transposase